jgi:hypothetical protein
MDYCHPCGRHLNGALACAGCGTPVEELRRLSPSAPEPEPVQELVVTLEPADSPGPRRSRRQAAPRRRSTGRRGRKRRGRKVLLGTVGLVLAAGALSLAELAVEGAGDDGAATAVREDPVAETTEPEPSASDESPDGPDRVSESATTKSGSPRPGKSRTAAGDGEGGKGTDGEGGEVEGDGPEPSGSPSDGDGSPSPSPSSSGDPEAPDEPGDSDAPADPGGEDPPPPPQPEPEPEPEPSETCERWLFWCI